MCRAVRTHRTPKSPLIFVNRSSMAIHVTLVRHQLLTDIALELAMLRLQVIGHLGWRSEKVIADRAWINRRRIRIVGIADFTSNERARVLHVVDVIFGLHKKGRIIFLRFIDITGSGFPNVWHIVLIFREVHEGHWNLSILGGLICGIDDLGGTVTFADGGRGRCSVGSTPSKDGGCRIFRFNENRIPLKNLF